MSDKKEQSTNVFSVITGIAIVYFVIKFCFFSSGTESNFIDSIFGSDSGTKSSLLESLTKGCKKSSGQWSVNHWFAICYCDNTNYKWDTVNYDKDVFYYRGEDTVYEEIFLKNNKGNGLFATVYSGDETNVSFKEKLEQYNFTYEKGYALVKPNGSSKVYYMPEKDVFNFLNGTNR